MKLQESANRNRLYNSYCCNRKVVSDSFMIPWAVAHQAPLSMEFSRQENWSELPFPSPRDLSNPRIKFGSPALQADSLLTKPPRKLNDIVVLFLVF